MASIMHGYSFYSDNGFLQRVFTKGFYYRFLLWVFTKGFYYEILIMTCSKSAKWLMICSKLAKRWIKIVVINRARQDHFF